MPEATTCGATFTTTAGADDLVCDLDAGHDGDLHSDDGHQWSVWA